ncbi:hypothetical protein L7F22_065591 [Adiantum nelumboides]|nr:hypothetical protein [Adiantum nelumboides]
MMQDDGEVGVRQSKHRGFILLVDKLEVDEASGEEEEVIRLKDIKMAPKMARKRKLTFLANVDMVSGEPRRWYIDIYDVQGNKLPRPHVLICNLEDKDSFEDVGQLWSVCMSVLDSNPDIQCLDIFVPRKLSYHLFPQANATDCMVCNKEDTMFSRGWNIEANDAANFTCEVLQSAISEIQQWKPPKASGKSERTPKKPRKRVSTMLDTTEAKAGPSTLGLPNSKRLVKMAKKAKDSPLGEISQYADFFPLGLYREFEIPVAKCFLAPEHIICRSMSEDKLEIILGWFTSTANNPTSCAYLMPIDWVQEHKAIPKKKDQVKVEDIQNYDYWIVDGQHSISCAKMLVTTDDLDEGLVHLKDVYRYRKARIIVDAPTQVTVAISRIANIEAQALLTKQPYNDILKHLRAQYIHYGKPSRPGLGIAKRHASRVSWDLYIVLIYLSKGKRFDGYGSFSSSKGPILDESLLDIEYKIVRPMDPRAYLREKKTMLFNKCINLYCTEGLMVIDAYSDGFVSRCALKERREVMGLVESIKEREELHSKLLSFTTSGRQIKEWANIVEDLQTAAQDQQQAIESSTSKTQLVLENKTPPSKPFDPRDDESENEDEDQMNIVKGLEGLQVNKPNLYNNEDREYRQKLLINDTKGSHGATEHQLQPILLEAEVHEDASTLAWQPSSSLQGTCH